MPRKPIPPIRWTIQQAAAEFGIDKNTLSTRIRAASIRAGDDSRYSTKQILAALHGDRGAELTGKTRAEKENWQLRNEEIRRTRIPLEDLAQVNTALHTAVRGTILASGLSDEAKQNIFADMRAHGDAMRELCKP